MYELFIKDGWRASRRRTDRMTAIRARAGAGAILAAVKGIDRDVGGTKVGDRR